MPSTTGIRRGFGLRPGERVGRAEIMSCEMGHDMKEKNQKYEYPCKIEFRAKDDETVKASWKRNIGSKPRIIHSEYGSPYECWFDEPSKVWKENKDTVAMAVKAVANRRRDIPTLRQIASKQKPPEPPDEIQALEPTCKVVRAHWATSRCGTCRDKILPGQMIAKRETGKGIDTSRGWSHVHCLASASKVVPSQPSAKRKRGRPRKGDEPATKRVAKRMTSSKSHTRKTDKQDTADVKEKTTRGYKRKAPTKPGRKRTNPSGVKSARNSDQITSGDEPSKKRQKRGS